MEKAEESHLSPTKKQIFSNPPAGSHTRRPATIRPYLDLIRLRKPAGIVYLYIPCLAGTLLAAVLADEVKAAAPSAVLETSKKFLVGSFIFRSAACTWNDILDQDIDRKVTRTRNRPLARGDVSTSSALLFTAIQALLGLWLLLASFPRLCFWYSLPSIALIALYPLAKRFTQYPQAILGLTWAYGFVISFPAMGVDLGSSSQAAHVSGALYFSGIAWTILYDTVYAHQDIVDDKKEGVKSIAIKFESAPKQFLSFLATVQIGFLLYAGYSMNASFLFYLGCLSVSITLVTLIIRVNLQDPASCSWWFHRGICCLTGTSMVLGCLGEYATRVL